MAKEKPSALQMDMDPTPPGEDIACKRCIFAQPGKYGYTNCYCEKYSTGYGKPTSILFRNGGCHFFEEGEPGWQMQ